MAYSTQFTNPAPSLERLAELPGIVAIEFGVDWCPHCQNAQPLLQQALQDRVDITHVKVEDGPGRKLGRSFKVTLWPTIVMLRDGQEIARITRPKSAQDINQQLPTLAEVS